MTSQVLNRRPPYLLSKSRDVPDNGTGVLTEQLEIARLDLESVRLSTFKDWPNRLVEPKQLARAGFYYLGRADVVECYECGVKGHRWAERDEPMDDHARWNKECPFVRRNNASESDGAPRRDGATQPAPGRDVCGNLGVEIVEGGADKEPGDDYARLGISRARGPSHPDQITLEQRLATFENWPKSLKQKPPDLASAGFFYMGVGDKTLCFYCGGGLRDWDEEDDPWEQHALWFPKCNYLLLKKTQTFVDAVQRKHQTKRSEEEKVPPQPSASSSAGEEVAKPPPAVAEGEEKRLEDNTALCKICYRNELGVVFLPCGHMVACADCASALKECAVCRKPIEATVRAFLS